MHSSIEYFTYDMTAVYNVKLEEDGVHSMYIMARIIEALLCKCLLSFILWHFASLCNYV